MTHGQDRELDIAGIEPGLRHLIEANAGTGKTYAIANLFLRWILDGRLAREILTVTFTRAATNELRGRIRKRLTEARQLLKAGIPPDKGVDPWFAGLPERHPEGEARRTALARLELALYEITEAPIHTIHGFCQQALTDHALGSGQPFALELADEGERIDRLLRDWWRLRMNEGDSRETGILLDILSDFDSFARGVRKLVTNPLMQLRPDPTVSTGTSARTLATLLSELADAWRSEGGAIRNLILDKNYPLNRQSHKISTMTQVLDRFDRALLQEPAALPLERQSNKTDLERLAASSIKFRARTSEEEKQRLLKHRTLELADQLQQQLERDQGAIVAAELAAARDFVRKRLATIQLAQGRQSFRDMIERLHQALCGDSDHSRRLAAALARQYPVIMVDEFQDTDPLQYAIFSRIHAAGRQAEQSLILIGDPKQAIYAFRGGDIFTYMQARDEADVHWHLAVNWRSTPEYIAAVNTLFARPNAFAYEQIPCHPSRAPDDATIPPLIVEGQPQPALLVEELPRQEDGTPFSRKNDAVERVHESVAGRIAWLLDRSAAGQARLGDESLKASDIAILVKSHSEGKAVREALLRRGVRAVAAGRDSVWQSPEAEALLALLEAALLPGDRNLQRQALACSLFDLRIDELHAFMAEPRRQAQWAELLAGTGERWRTYGFMSGFQHLLRGLQRIIPEPGDAAPKADGGGWLARVPQPERSLTNLEHLAELLQAASASHAAPEHLLGWMRQQRKAMGASDDTLLRLESDEALVHIVTIHASKGLEYPVVFVPYQWSPRGVTNGDIEWHEPDSQGGFHHCYSHDGKAANTNAAEHERLAEDIRLTYVALTRGTTHCHLFCGPAGRDWPSSPLAWLLDEAEHDFEQDAYEAAEGVLDPKRLLQRTVDGEPLEQYPEILRVTAPREYDASVCAPAEYDRAEALEHAKFRRKPSAPWSVGSFSAMTRGVHQAIRAPAAEGTEHFALRYPAGAHIGNFLHALLERLDPAAPIEPQITRMDPWLFERHGIRDDDIHRDHAGLAAWMEAVLHTPLDDSGLKLADIPRGARLHELEFDLGIDTVNPDAIDALLRTWSKKDRGALNFEAFRGLLTGAIDLVFEHEGHYFLADYKSNLLGRRLEDYLPDRLQREILDRYYDLQYLIYALALHRHLRQRLPGYDYERHFGGVYYLFLRGMRPEHGPARGIFFDRPNADLLREFDERLIGRPGRDAA